MNNKAREIPYYYRSINWERLVSDFPPPPLFENTNGKLSSDALHTLQEVRFLQRVADAWAVPFYSHHWRKSGLEPGDIRCLDDIDKIPFFTSSDLKNAIAEHPPFGNHHGLGRDDFGSLPLKIQTSGGTTGLPRVSLFDPIAWEVQGIQMARAMYAQGARPGDIMQISYTNSLANAAWCAVNATHNWLGCVPLTTGSGVVTPSAKQLEYAFAWGTNGWFARGEYLGRLASVAREEGLDLHRLPLRHIHSFLGVDGDGHLRRQLQDAWGAPVYDNYGTHEVGLIAFECEIQRGMHVSEDTVYLQVMDVNSDQLLLPGSVGNLVVTSLHRSLPPIIRYNLQDLMALQPRRTCDCGLHTAILSNFQGRSDEMVKLRGTNVYPLACQSTIIKDSRTTGDYLCVARYVGSGLARREEMIVRVERKSYLVDADCLRNDLIEELHRNLGVRVDVEVVEAGALAVYTRMGGEGKVRRLLDERK